MTKSKKRGVYAIRCSNGKMYIGSSVDLIQRKSAHFSTLRRRKHVNIHLQRAFDSLGHDSVSWCILEEINQNTSQEYLLEREQYWIDLYFNEGSLFNFNPKAAVAGRRLSRETIKKRQESRGVFKHSEESKRKISSALKGRDELRHWKGKPGSFTGRKHSEESKRKSSETKKGIPSKNKGVKRNKPAWNKGIPGTKGRPAWNKGKPAWNKGVPSSIRGEDAKNSKLTWNKVREIRERSASGEPRRSIAKDMGVTTHTIGHIVRNKTWKEIR